MYQFSKTRNSKAKTCSAKVRGAYGRAAGAFVLVFLLCIAGHLQAATQSRSSGVDNAPKDIFKIDDYFHVHYITDIALSSDGKRLAYTLETNSLEKNARVRQVYLQSLQPRLPPELHPEFSNATHLTWVPNRHCLGFVETNDAMSQILIYDTATQQITVRAQSKDPITEFKFSSDGNKVAYITLSAPKQESLLTELREGSAGIIVDPDDTSYFDFVNPSWSVRSLTYGQNAQLWGQSDSNPPRNMNVPGDVKEFFWSPDGKMLSVTYVDDGMPISLLRFSRTSIAVIEFRSTRFTVIAAGQSPSSAAPGERFTGGEWIPGERKIVVRRAIENGHPWYVNAFRDWSVVGTDRMLELSSVQWTSHEVYTDGLAIFPESDTSMPTANTIDAIHSLYPFKLTDPEHGTPSSLLGVDGGSTLFSLTTDHRHAAFVNQSLVRPPEIYVGDLHKHVSNRISAINDDVAKLLTIRSREITWAGFDGATVHGWLLEPDATKYKKPWPLITYVHGGPSVAYHNSFASNFADPQWAYPLEVYAESGIAVFIPNYRGSYSFGRQITKPTKIDGEPADDIAAGINHLVDAGVAEGKELGISGHSHGAYLGPLVMTRMKNFRAASFAEGMSNYLVGYELMDGRINREIHDWVADANPNGSPYEIPQRYLDLSPDLHMDGVNTPALYEAGAESQAIVMLGLAKATRRFGNPSEFVVYPHTRHGAELPSVQKEIAERNLDWFLYWLKDERNPDPAKNLQYEKWRHGS